MSCSQGQVASTFSLDRCNCPLCACLLPLEVELARALLTHNTLSALTVPAAVSAVPDMIACQCCFICPASLFAFVPPLTCRQPVQLHALNLRGSIHQSSDMPSPKDPSLVYPAYTLHLSPYHSGTTLDVHSSNVI